MAEQPSPVPVFDVFLSHNSKDKPTVIALAKRLERAGVKVWLDAWELRPGHPWQDALEEIIASTRSAAVLVGQDGMGPWENREMRALLNQFVRRGLPVIPVLLPDCPQQPELPLLLQEFTWVDCRKGKEEEGFHRLVWGITGVKPQSIQEPKASSSDGNKPKNAQVLKTALQKANRILPMAGAAALIAVAERAYVHFSETSQLPTPSDKIAVAPPLSNTAASNHTEIKNPLPTGEGRVKAEKPVQATPAPSKACADCPEMVPLPAGEFMMGAAPGEAGSGKYEQPRHLVKINAFSIGKYEVTQGQWKAIMGSNPSNFNPCGDNCPVESVSWNEVQTFIKTLNQKTGGHYRLPSEAEWEYACRAGQDTLYCGGNDLDAVAWHVGNSGKEPHPVGGKQGNAFGLYDMSGNVWEWVQDCSHDSYQGAPGDGSAWGGGAECAYRVLRGGAFYHHQYLVRWAYRYYLDPDSRPDYYGGFRVVVSPL